ncbi:hypothetical protein EWM64_g5287 [Hericium alpestre]|uniref:Uncharacterized protein n=1 Tax=Hericium alpestre TaxID=135208 RepID=A0A4Y9ZVZ4_9AGAM|nr:hypothetical protein EWM64_g5287 [Hericium alpestre]
MERLEAWASAMLKGNTFATLTQPLRHKLFDISSKALSPVMARRMESQQTKGAPSAAAAPVFNFSIGSEVLSLFRPDMAASGVVAAPNSDSSDALVHPSRKLGPDMSLIDFCVMHNLGETVLDRFTKNGYKNTCSLKFVKISELKEMGFLLGEVAMLRDAVEGWSAALEV